MLSDSGSPKFGDVNVSQVKFGDVNVIADHIYRLNFVARPQLGT